MTGHCRFANQVEPTGAQNKDLGRASQMLLTRGRWQNDKPHTTLQRVCSQATNDELKKL